jgi:uncharacterized protein
MKNIIHFFSQGGNAYIYNNRYNRINLIHPYLSSLIHFGGEKIDNHFDLDEAQIKYYKQKVSYLKKFDLLTDVPANIHFLEMQPQDIICELANTNQVTFEVTDTCNLNCRYCGYGEFYDNYDQRSNKKMGFVIAVRMLDYLANLWKTEINTSQKKNVYISFYGGEPLLNMEFIKKVVDYVEHIDCPTRIFTFSMTSNAILLNRHMDYLAEKNFKLLISLDGNFENTAYRVDKKGRFSFNKVEGNVELLKNKFPQYFDMSVNFNAVLHDKNSIEEIYNYFKSKYNKIPHVGVLNHSGIRLDKKKLFNKTFKDFTESLNESKDYKEIENDMFLETPNYKRSLIFLTKHSGYIFSDYCDLLNFQNEKKSLLPTGTCIPFSRKIFITVNGKILPCERIGQQWVLGFITEKSLGLNFKNISDYYNSQYSKIMNQCEKCYNKSTCDKCIFNFDLSDVSIKCNSILSKRKFESYLSSNISFLELNVNKLKVLLTDVNLK